MFAITFENQTVGFAKVQKEGCFYRISCSCDLLPSGSRRIFVTDGNATIDLGICVPNGGRFVLTKRIPVRCLEQDNLQFSFMPECDNIAGIPVETGKAFAELNNLRYGKYRYQNGQGQIFIDSVPNRQGSDQTQAYPSKSEP